MTRLSPTVRCRSVTLRVRDLERVADFYSGGVGLERHEAAPDVIELGPAGRPVVLLERDEGAAAGTARVGLYHLALLFPDRPSLAEVALRVAEQGYRLSGASDHRVSEALYLDDPEGNGVELYRDRPREAWPWQGGMVAMATEPLDLPALLAEASAGEGTPGTSRVVLGHVHLQAIRVDQAEAFYRDVVGMDVMARYGRDASFLSAGGYHHHVGVNQWGTQGLDRASGRDLGLKHVNLETAEPADLTHVQARLEAAGSPYHRLNGEGGGLSFNDPSGHEIRFELVGR